MSLTIGTALMQRVEQERQQRLNKQKTLTEDEKIALTLAKRRAEAQKLNEQTKKLKAENANKPTDDKLYIDPLTDSQKEEIAKINSRKRARGEEIEKVPKQVNLACFMKIHKDEVATENTTPVIQLDMTNKPQTKKKKVVDLRSFFTSR